MKQIIPCKKCGVLKCGKHCNHCSEDIFFRPPLLDPEIAYKGPLPVNRDGSPHRCMLRGTKDGNYYNIKNEIRYPRAKASVILCPEPKCEYAIVDPNPFGQLPTGFEMVNELSTHLSKKHGLTIIPELFERIQERIVHMRTNPRIHYTDPFLYVGVEEVMCYVKS